MLKILRNTAGLCFYFIHVFAHSQNAPAGAASAGIAHASVACSDLWSAFNNQSGIGWVQGCKAGVFYENRFILPELSRQGFAFVLPLKKVGVFGLSCDRFGYSQFNENKFGICYARKFGEVFSLAVQLNVHWIHIGDIYGNLVTATGEVSFQVKPNKKWVLAGHVFNPTRTPLAEFQREKLNTVFRLGTLYRFNEKIFASLEVEASIEHPPIGRAGAEYRPMKLLFLRAGMSTTPFSGSMGLGFYFKKVQLDFASRWNPVLGFSPQVALSYDFAK